MSLAHVDVAILCGGKQTRAPYLRVPKVLAPIAGRPLVEHILDRLKKYEAKRVTLCAGHMADDIHAWAKQRQKDELQIAVMTETEQRGERAAMQLFFAANPDCGCVLFWNGDTLIDGDLSWLGKRGSYSFSVRGVPCGICQMERWDTAVPMPTYDATGILEFIDIGTPEGYALAQERYK